MSYTLDQVKPLLTKPELELFQQSEADTLESLTLRQVNGKITRARAMRDKYRDLYQRQTAHTLTQPAAKRSHTGGDNERTNTKAEVLQHMLQRFEAQRDELLANGATLPKPRVPKAPGVPAKKTNPRASQTNQRDVGEAPASGNADRPMRGNTNTRQRQIARRDRAANDLAEQVVEARQQAARQAAADTPAQEKNKTPAKAPAKTKARSKKADTSDISQLVGAVRKAVKLKAEQVQHAPDNSPDDAPVVSSGATALSQGSVPTHMPAEALRQNPLKAEPVNMKIHASARSQMRSHQAKRDSR